MPKGVSVWGFQAAHGEVDQGGEAADLEVGDGAMAGDGFDEFLP